MNANECDGERSIYQRRVLVVDNVPEFRQDHGENLNRWGFQPVLAKGMGDMLIQDAIELVRKERCQLAIVDMRLRDDDDRNDDSGLCLAPNLLPARTIVVTGYGDLATARKARDQFQAFNIIGKEEGPGVLLEAIHSALEDSCENYIDIEWPLYCSPPEIIQRLELEPVRLLQDQPHTAICRLYASNDGSPSLTQLKLESLTDRYQAQKRALSSSRSLILVARGRRNGGAWFQEEVIKIAPAHKIDQEIKAYNGYVRNYLPPRYSARIEDSNHYETLWDIGAIRYTNIESGQWKLFQIWYEQEETSIDQLAVALRNLFKQTLDPWYRHVHGAPKRECNLFRYYLYTIPKLERLSSYPDQSPSISIADLPFQLRNPVVWVQENKEHSNFVSYWEVITHGDLHVNNIFANQNAETCVIDYEHTGPGHFLRDFVELEADIVLRLFSFERAQLSVAFRLAVILLTPRVPDAQLAQLNSIDDLNLQKEVDRVQSLVQAVRKLAGEVTDFEQMQEYYWALLMDSLHYLLRRPRKTDDKNEVERVRIWAQLWCALICERIEKWDVQWPPAEWCTFLNEEGI